jgi:hypothetical protein
MKTAAASAQARALSGVRNTALAMIRRTGQAIR